SEDPLRQPIRLLGDCNRVYRRSPLQARCRIDHVPGDDPFAVVRPSSQRDHRLPGRDPNTHLQRQIGIRLVQLLDRIQDPQPSPHRRSRVALVRPGTPENGHARIADELPPRPAIALDLLPKPCVIRADPRPHVLRISLVGGGREPDQVAEQHGHDLALLLSRRPGLLSQRRAAERAERELARNLLPARRTRQHTASLGRLTESREASRGPPTSAPTRGWERFHLVGYSGGGAAGPPSLAPRKRYGIPR